MTQPYQPQPYFHKGPPPARSPPPMDPRAPLRNGVPPTPTDGAWNLTIHITDLRAARTLPVKGDLHIGGLMLRLVEAIDVSRDWSDHALWWPSRRKWLLHTRSTLDQIGVGAETELEFTPMHKMARVQLPDLQMVDTKLDFSQPVFNAVIQLAKELGIRHPEELSMKRYITPDELKRGLGYESDYLARTIPGIEPPGPGTLKRQTPIFASVQNLGQTSRAGTPQHQAAYTTDNIDSGGAPRSATLSPMSRGGANYREGPGHLPLNTSGATFSNGTILRSPVLTSLSWGEPLSTENFDPQLVNTPKVSLKTAEMTNFRPAVGSFEQKAVLNRCWLDSSRSLMEQGVFEGDTVQLRFRFMSFFDLNSKYDPVRVNQLFEQAKWSLLLDELDCTEEEAYMFAALQAQAQTMAGRPERRTDEGTDVDLMLSELEQQLDAAATTAAATHAALGLGADLTQVPELGEYMKYFKPKKLTLKQWKRGFFVFRDLSLSYYHSVTDAHGAPVGHFNLKGCEVTPDVNLQSNKYGIKLLIPSHDGMYEFMLKCENEQQYVKWMAACRLAARGKTMADASAYQQEMESLKRLLQMQQPTLGHPSSAPAHHQPPPIAPRQTEALQGASNGTQNGGNGEVASLPSDLEPDECLPLKYSRRGRSRNQIMQRISDAHRNVRGLTATEAKLQYIRAWEALPEHGTHFFTVRFRGGKRIELLGVAHNRLMRMNMDNGDSLKTWRFSTMKKWHVNWEIKHVLIQFENEDLEFKPISADCKVVHEFIGGYIFLSMRSKEQNQSLDEALFHKLTSGWA